jgi:2-deoxy-D-gluconate 3-dehydrogenase
MTTKAIAQLFDLTGKAAIVTGGAMGIGQAIAFRLGEAGARVMITDIDLDGASQTVEKIKASGGQAKAIEADAGSVEDAKRAVQATMEQFGRLDILVNNAGIFFLKSALKASEGRWDRLFHINLKGVFFYSQAAAQEMIKAGRGGKIINIASKGALHPTNKMALYDASKGGMVTLTKSLALEFAPHNILVNAVAPGGIITPSVEREDAVTLLGGERRLPLGRLGEPDDIARVVLFLASAAADYMTGDLIVVDGGFMLS